MADMLPVSALAARLGPALFGEEWIVRLTHREKMLLEQGRDLHPRPSLLADAGRTWRVGPGDRNTTRPASATIS